MTHTELSLPIRVGDDWWVSSTVGKEAGYLMAEVVKEEDELMPPVKEWQYGVVGGFFDSDQPLFAAGRCPRPAGRSSSTCTAEQRRNRSWLEFINLWRER